MTHQLVQKYWQKIVMILVFTTGRIFAIDLDVGSNPRISFLNSSSRAGKKEEARKWETMLFFDSILNIIKAYYVDTQKSEDKYLLLAAIDGLTRTTSLKYHRDAKKVQFILGKKTKVIDLDQINSQEKVVNWYMVIVDLLELNPSLVREELRKSFQEKHSIVIHALLASLDAHSGLLSADEYKELKQGTEGKFGGLGVLVGVRDEVLTVIKPIPKSPASRVGMVEFDRIISINGKKTYGYSLSDLVEHMKGEPGTDVNLTYLRKGFLSSREVKLTRELITVDSVTSKTFSTATGQVLYILIDSFSSRTSDEVDEAIKRFKSAHSEGVKGIILDLRSNPGGLLDQAVKVADLFIEKGIIVRTIGKHYEIESAKKGDEPNWPIVLLINGDSASASEIVAGALQDHKKALVIGEPSYGKGSVQTLFELPNNEAIKLTIARYYTPFLRSIQNQGITPDLRLHHLAKLSMNTNLLGEDRYRSESSLTNHLLEHEIGPVQQSADAAIDIYYPLDTLSESATQDREIEVALTILESIDKNKLIKREQNNADAWLREVRFVIEQTKAKWNTPVENYLAKTFAINWSGVGEKDCQLTLDINKQNDQKVFNGDLKKLPYRIKNEGKTACSKVSVFVSGDQIDFPTTEVLVGLINPGHEVRGVVDLRVPGLISEKELRLIGGLALNGQVDKMSIKRFELKVQKRSMASVNVDVAFVDGKNGKIDGVLEENEKARIKLSIVNTSAIPATGVQVKLFNLAGDQIEISVDSLELAKLGAYERRDVYLDICGSKTIVSSKIDLGIFVGSYDLAKPYKKLALIQAVPSGKES